MVSRTHPEPDEPLAPVDLRLVPAALATWTGCLLGLFTGHAAWWVAGAAAVLCAATAARSAPWRSGLIVVGVFGLVGTAHAALLADRAGSDPAVLAAGRGAYATVELTVRDPPQPVRSRFTTESADTGTPVPRFRIAGRIERLTIAGAATTSSVSVSVIGSGQPFADLIPGQHISVSGRLSVDDFPALPGVRITVRGPPATVREASWPYRVAGQVRAALRANAAVLAPDPAGLLPGLVVGDTTGIDDRLTEDAKATGLTHLLAVSGSHVVLLCGLVVVVVGRFGPRAAVAGGTVMIVALVLVVGPQPSVLRAVVMGGIGLLGLLSGRPRVALPALAAAALALLLIDPTLAASFGFTLSVLATGGLVLLAPGWALALRRRGWPRGLAELLVIPVAAQVATLPVIVALSGQVSLAALPANLAVAPVIPIALVLGFVAAVIGPWWPAGAQLVVRADGPLLTWVTSVAHTLARQPGATVPWPATPAGIAGIVVVLVGAFAVLRHRRGRAALMAVGTGVAVVLVPVGIVGVPGWPPPGWLLAVCEVGQGDALVLATDAPGTAVVVDTGPDPPLVDGCLDRLGVTTVPLVILTHLHADHIDGLTGAFDGRSVGVVGVGPQREPVQAWHQVLQESAAAGLPVVALDAGTSLQVGGLALQVLGPARAYHGTESDPNNDSVVVMASRSGVRMLLTGDIELPAQQALLASGADLSAEVLKVPHHGSATLDPRLPEAVGAEVAVIGVGADNDYGHPSGRTLDAVRAAGAAAIGRTDTDGDVAVCLAADGLVVVTRGPALVGVSG